MKKNKSILAVLMSIIIFLSISLGNSMIGLAAEDYQDISSKQSEGVSLTKYIGVWYDKKTMDSGRAEENNPIVKLVITGISENKLLFSICQEYCMLDSAIAEKQADGSYQFSFKEERGDFLTRGTYGNELTGKFTFDGMKLTADIQGSKTDGLGYQGELVYYSGLFKGTRCNLLDFMTDYKTAISRLKENQQWSITLNEDKDTGLVAELSPDVSMGFWSEQSCYEVEGITRGSFQEECIAKFGQPVSQRKTGNYTEVVYQVDGKYYLTSLLNAYGAIKTMKISYINEEEVLELKIDGDYKIRGTKIVEYIGGYDEEKKITIPKGITEIGERAFSIDDDIVFTDQYDSLKKVSLCIPKDVKIDENAFNTIGPMKITFAKGRKKIEKKAFNECAKFVDGRKEGMEIIEITLPSTIKSIGESSFASCSYSCSIMTLKLNEGIEVIEDYALSGTKCKLPSTVKKLGDYALNDWWIDLDVKGELSGGYVVLPKGLQEIGNHCIGIEWPTQKIKIPASVKKIGECPISYGDNPYRGGVVVDKKNRYYKSDKNGWLYTKDGKKLLYAASFHGDLVVPEGVEYVGEGTLNLDPNGEGGPQKIILPKSLKKYNRWAALYGAIVFQGDPPKLVGKKESEYFQITLYVPKKKLDAYQKTFGSWKNINIIGQ